jgi:hypothetical protein
MGAENKGIPQSPSKDLSNSPEKERTFEMPLFGPPGPRLAVSFLRETVSDEFQGLHQGEQS